MGDKRRTKRNSLEVIARRVQFLSKTVSDSADGPQQSAPAAPSSASDDDEEIPF